MRILLKNIRPAHDPSQLLNLLIDRDSGHSAVAAPDDAADEKHDFQGRNVFASPGWIDLRAFCGEPGDERVQTLTSLADDAARGGYGQVVLHPHHAGQFDNEAEIQRITSLHESVRFSVAAPISEGLKGRKLRELMHLAQAGALAFGDGYRPEGDVAFYAQALQYSRNMGLPIFIRPDVPAISQTGQAYEGDVSARTGLAAVSPYLELASVRQYLLLNESIGARLHFTSLTDPAAIEAVEVARTAGATVSYDVSAIHLVHDERTYERFDADFKVYPFLRPEADVLRLRELIRKYRPAISSGHFPNTPEAKDTDFTHAEFGARTLHLAPWSVIWACGLTAEEAYHCFHAAPAAVLGLPPLVLEGGTNLDLTVFQMDAGGQTEMLGANNSNTSPLLLRFYRNTMFTSTALLP